MQSTALFGELIQIFAELLLNIGVVYRQIHSFESNQLEQCRIERRNIGYIELESELA